VFLANSSLKVKAMATGARRALDDDPLWLHPVEAEAFALAVLVRVEQRLDVEYTIFRHDRGDERARLTEPERAALDELLAPHILNPGVRAALAEAVAQRLR
jgi:hypothetical protein